MLILSLRLEGFKSYKDNLIEFTPGTNAIVGHNGAGKSSLLEAIGFVLFDHSPDGVRQPELVHEDAKSATVTVAFLSGKDERRYEVVRRCGASSKYEVYDPELDTTICDTKVDVIDFLREHLGVESTANLPDIFCNAVGVPQGTFTNTFLLTPANRKPIFDPLLRVEEYRKAFENLREPERQLKDRQQSLDVTISGLEARLERLPVLQEEVHRLQRAICQAEASLEETREILQAVHERRELLDEQRRRVDSLRADVQRAREQVDSWASQLERAVDRVEEATKAHQRVDESRSGHEAYQKAQVRQKELDAQRLARQSLWDRRGELDKRLSVTEARLSQYERELQEIVEAEQKAEELAGSAARQDELEAALEEAKVQATRLAGLQAQLQRQQKSVRAAEDALAATQKRLKNADEVRTSLTHTRERADVLQQELLDSQNRLGKLESEAERLKEQIQILEQKDSGSPCPVCERPLDNDHREALLDRNSSRLTEIRQRYQEARGKVQAIQSDLAACKRAAARSEQDLQSLPRPEEEEASRSRLADAREQLVELETQAGELAGPAARADTLQKEVEGLGNPRNARELALKTTAKKPAVLQNIEHCRKSLASMRSELAEVEAKLTDFTDLDEELERIARTMEAAQEADDIYRRNVQLAESLVKRKEEAQIAQDGMSGAEKTLQTTQKTYAELAEVFDEDAYQELVQEEEALRSSRDSLTGQLSQQCKQVEAREAEIEELQQRKAELEQATTQRQKLQQEQELLGYLRSVLKEAGPYVTRALVRQISYEANKVFGDIMQDYTRFLKWTEDYGISLEIEGRERQFSQLSGGEQMSAALAVRLALLREMSEIDVAFFDEPTTNLDETRRDSLARQIMDIKGFQQLFVISHDDTFEQATDTLIRVRKENGTSVAEVNLA